MRMCKVEGCDRIVRTMEYCDMHYQRSRWGEDLLLPDKRSGVNEYTIQNDIVTMLLSYKGGKEKCLIDVEDLELVLSINRKFHAVKLGNTLYAHMTLREEIGYSHKQMHRLIMGVEDQDVIVDHTDGNGLNNRKKTNLRIVSKSVNLINRHGVGVNNTSGCVGVFWDKQKDKWCAKITIDKKDIWLGQYDNKEEAATIVKEYREQYLKEVTA